MPSYARVTLETVPLETDAEQVRAVIDTVREFDSDTLRVEVTGDAARGALESGGGAAEGVGILAALVVLVFLFGSFLAASLPVLSAVFAVSSSIALAILVSHVTSIPSYAAPRTALVGLGVGIDYALLIFILIWTLSITTCMGLALATDTHLRRRTRNRPNHAERHEDNDGGNRSRR